MAKWIRVIEGLPVVEIKPTSSEGFSDNELMMLIGTSEPSRMFPFDDGTVLLFDDESTAPINERACALLQIPTAGELRAMVIANGVKPDEQLLARADNERAWEIRGDVLLAHAVQEPGETTAEEKLTEKLADQAHASWSHWMQYLFSKSEKQADGSVVIPGGLVARWERQMNTPYSQLAEQEKQSDREQAAALLPIISESVNG